MSINKHKKKILLVGSLFVLGVLIFVVVLNKSDYRSILDQLDKITLPQIFWLILITFTILFFYSVNLRLIIRSFGPKVPVLKSAVLKLIGDSVSYVTPMMYIGGEFMIAYILKRDYKLPVTKGMAANVLEKMITLTITIFYLVVGVAIFLIKFTENIKILIPTIIIMAGSICFLIYFYKKTLRNSGMLYPLLRFLRLDKIKFIRNGKEAIERFDQHLHYFLKYHPRYFFYCLGLVFIGTVMTLLQYKLVLFFLGHTMSFIDLLMLRVIFMAAAAVPIPGGLGTQEAAQAGYFNLLGLGASTGVAFILVLRFLQLINISLGLTFLSFFGFKIFKPPEISDDNQINNNG